ncbi:MAG: preprotein translocase subunit SecG [Bdellovibrionaceae bacterium]|nr:preprotein translocase subunit SecG [Pseudobdellovibrionaceae bacterium]
MISFFVVIHVILAIFLIVFILLQDSKGGALDGLAGQSKSVFGASGASNFLSSTTKWLSVFLAGTSLILTYLVGHQETSLLDKYKTSKTNTQEQTSLNKKAPINKKDAKSKTK